MTKLKYRKECPFCKSSLLDVIRSIPLVKDRFASCLSLNSLEGLFNQWLLCRNCDLRFSSIYMTKSSQRKLYENYRKLYNSDSNPKDYFKRLNSLPEGVSENLAKIRILKESLKTNGREISQFNNVLDCGCGAGNMLFKLKTIYPNLKCYGFEPTPDFAKFASSILNNNVVNSYLEDYHSLLSFDLITLFHVFEHLTTPFDSLEKLKKLLSKSGYIYIVVPSILDFNSKNDCDERFMIQHLYYYSEFFMKNLATSLQLELVETKENLSIRKKRDTHYLFRMNSE